MTSIVEELASRGYVVVTIDHIHDSGIVGLPDGRLVTSAVPQFTDADEIPLSIKEIESRAADVSFILDQLAAISRGGNPDHEHRPLPRGLHDAFDLDSDSGSTAVHALHTDPRVKAGVSLDGTLWTPQSRADTDHALLLFGRTDLDLQGSGHAIFSDIAVIAPQAAPIVGISQAQLIATYGAINGDRAVAIQRTYINAWFDKYLRDHDSDLLDGPSPLYPEVVFAHPTDADRRRRFAR
jgi:hypothetical protein